MLIPLAKPTTASVTGTQPTPTSAPTPRSKRADKVRKATSPIPSDSEPDDAIFLDGNRKRNDDEDDHDSSAGEDDVHGNDEDDDDMRAIAKIAAMGARKGDGMCDTNTSRTHATLHQVKSKGKRSTTAHKKTKQK